MAGKKPSGGSKSEESRYFAIEGALNYERAGELRERLLETLDGASNVEVSLAGVSEIDLAGAQLLVSAHKSAQQRGIELAIDAGENQPRMDRLATLAGIRIPGTAKE
jgi:anti-anti-sigma regulatory factor